MARMACSSFHITHSCLSVLHLFHHDHSDETVSFEAICQLSALSSTLLRMTPDLLQVQRYRKRLSCPTTTNINSTGTYLDLRGLVRSVSRWVCCAAKDEDDDKHHTTKYGGGSVMLWVYFSPKGLENVLEFKRRPNAVLSNTMSTAGGGMFNFILKRSFNVGLTSF
ncbi:hypothetical protein ILYODFUR_027818 [Ilyodon furcidens]|uniref:Uncharacterized protein n=1 Tax=Ilyodon furcidens TaxID=33524 RepID=A0ABV0TD35_9TELE